MTGDIPGEFARTAVVAVDFQGECIDGDGVWPIFNRDQVLRNAKTALDACRDAGLPIIYTQHWLDPRGVDALRHEPRIDGRPTHSLAGSPKAAIHPHLAPTERDIILRKQRWSAFYGTNLELMLNQMDVDHLILFGVWTEACFETTVWDAIWRDYRVTIVKDACGSATELMHMTAILDLANWLYAGAIVDAGELSSALQGRPHRAWHFERPSAFAYTLNNVQSLYESL